MRGAPPANRKPMTSANVRAVITQAMSACNCVTAESERSNRGTVCRCPAESISVPASGPVPVTTVPAASISPVTPVSTPASTRRSGRTGRTSASGPVPASAFGLTRTLARACSTTAAVKMIAVDSRKCAATSAGFSRVSTTIPPSTAWATTPSGSSADSHSRSRRARPLRW